MKKSFEFKTIIEPFRIKMVEPLPLLSCEERVKKIKKAHYNLFTLDAQDVTFDFLTDSGTSAMSAAQWSGMMIGDESYAGSQSFKRFEKTVQNLTSHEFVIPTHQGRSAEHLLMKALLSSNLHSIPAPKVLGNTHFDTTRANIEVAGGEARDLPCEENQNSTQWSPFKGNIDLKKLEHELKNHADQIPLVIMTVTNNSVGGQPVSLENMKSAYRLCQAASVPLFLDVARFAENAYFIKTREPGYEDRTIESIVHEMFEYSDGSMMSAKKDAFGNIGGFLTCKDSTLAETIRTLMVVTEGFPTYGGLAGRDLEALSIGLGEILDENYLKYRIRSTQYLGEGFRDAGFKMVEPFGGHAVYIDAALTCPEIPLHQFPGQSISVALYEYLGVRSVEVGSVMLGKYDVIQQKEIAAPKELVRLAIPRRVYTQSHVDYILEGARQMRSLLSKLPGYRLTYQAPILRHFTAKFEPVQ